MRERFSVELKVTNRCNEECFHCMNNDQNTQEPEKTLDCELFVKRLEEAGSRDISGAGSVEEVRMTGGEPLLVPHTVARIARACSRQGVRSGVNTNGTLLDPSLARDLKAAGLLTMKISFDTLDDNTYQDMRGRDGSLSQNLRGIQAALAAEFHVILRFTLSGYNRGELLRCYEAAAGMSVCGFQVKPLIKAGRASGSDMFLEKEEVDAALRELEGFSREHALLPEVLCWPPVRGVSLKHRVCGNLHKLYFSSDFRASLCNYVPDGQFLGDLQQYSLQDLKERRSSSLYVDVNGWRLIRSCPNTGFFEKASRRLKMKTPVSGTE